MSLMWKHLLTTKPTTNFIYMQNTASKKITKIETAPGRNGEVVDKYQLTKTVAILNATTKNLCQKRGK